MRRVNGVLVEIWFCLACDLVREMDRAGRCVTCGSEAIVSACAPLRTGNQTGIERILGYAA